MELIYKVTDENNIIDILKNKLFISNRLYRKIKNSSIFVNGKKYDNKIPIKCGDIIKVNLDFNEDNSNIMPNKEIKLNILYEDEWLLVLEKDAFLPVHPSINYYENSLSNGVKYYYDIKNINKKIRPVNRLDKDTSGIVIFAKSEYIQDNIKILLKEYIAIAEGKFENQFGTINKPIARKDKSIIERCIDEKGENAITHYEVLKTFSNCNNVLSLVKCRLETGRTHQIRVHLSSIKHPILGDTLYGRASKLISRQALHCYNMKFIHPVTKSEINIISPIPEDMNQIISSS